MEPSQKMQPQYRKRYQTQTRPNSADWPTPPTTDPSAQTTEVQSLRFPLWASHKILQ